MARTPRLDPDLLAMLDTLARINPASRVEMATDYCINHDATRAMVFLNRVSDLLGIGDLQRLHARLASYPKFKAYSSSYLNILDRLPVSPNEAAILALLDQEFIATRSAPPTGVLVCCFCGNVRRLMLPLHFFDGYLAEIEVDVLYIRPVSGYFREGSAAFFDRALHRIESEMRSGGYERLYCLGTSSGGVPAHLAARALGARLSLSIGGGVSDVHCDLRQAWTNPHAKSDFRGANLLGELNDVDVAADRIMASELGTRTLLLRGIAKHALVRDMISTDTFRPLLRWWLHELEDAALPANIRFGPI